MAKGQAAEKPDARETRRMVLKRARVFVLPDDVTPEQIKALSEAGKAAKVFKGAGVTTELAWLEMGEHTGASKQQAIESYAGKSGTPDAKPGDYKAPGLTAWKGGRRYVKPELPKVEAEDIE